MNIYDISERSGYSIATVSRVINGKGNVSEKARTKILAVIDELGYVPNAYARGLGTGSVQTIGLLCLDVADMYLAGTVSILERELRAEGYHSLLSCTGPEPKDKIKAVSILLAQNVDAIILIGSHFIIEDNEYILNAAKKVPIILLNGFVEGENIYCVMLDDHGIVKEATERLLDNGHQRFLYIYDKKTASGLQKRRGFRDALQEAGIPQKDQMELLVSNDISSARQEVKNLLDSHKLFTGVVASEDVLAIAALKAMLSKEIQIPEQAEVIGYNNSLVAECSIPELTSIDSKMEALCMMAVSTLFGIFKGKSFPSKTMLTASLIERQTTNFQTITTK